VRGLALAGIFVILSLCFFSCDNRDKEWDDAPGTKSKMSSGRWFEGTWLGGPWGELVLRSEGDDSVSGSSDDGALSMVGRVSRYRIDMKLLSHDHEETSGYLYLIPGTDSLHVGIRGTEGEWETFFSLALTCPDVNQRRSAK